MSSVGRMYDNNVNNAVYINLLIRLVLFRLYQDTLCMLLDLELRSHLTIFLKITHFLAYSITKIKESIVLTSIKTLFLLLFGVYGVDALYMV